MKVNELRVENWVYNDDNTYSKIEGIRLFGDVVSNEIEIYSKDNVEGTLSISKLSPIPLTEEILLKCGFKNSKSNIITYTYINNPAYYITEIGNCFTFISCDKIRVRSIKYLHELQNLFFAITGEELEVEL